MKLCDSQNLLDEDRAFERFRALPPGPIDPMEIELRDTEGKAKLQVHRFWVTDLGVRVVISLMINWEIGEAEDEDKDDYYVGEWLEYTRDTVDLWSAAERERFIQYCRRRLKQLTYLTWNWGPVERPMELDWLLWSINDRIQLSIS